MRPDGLWLWKGKLTSTIPHNSRIIKAASLMTFKRFLSKRSKWALEATPGVGGQFCKVVVSPAPRIIVFIFNGRVFKNKQS